MYFSGKKHELRIAFQWSRVCACVWVCEDSSVIKKRLIYIPFKTWCRSLPQSVCKKGYPIVITKWIECVSFVRQEQREKQQIEQKQTENVTMAAAKNGIQSVMLGSMDGVSVPQTHTHAQRHSFKTSFQSNIAQLCARWEKSVHWIMFVYF